MSKTALRLSDPRTRERLLACVVDACPLWDPTGAQKGGAGTAPEEVPTGKELRYSEMEGTDGSVTYTLSVPKCRKTSSSNALAVQPCNRAQSRRAGFLEVPRGMPKCRDSHRRTCWPKTNEAYAGGMACVSRSHDNIPGGRPMHA